MRGGGLFDCGLIALLALAAGCSPREKPSSARPGVLAETTASEWPAGDEAIDNARPAAGALSGAGSPAAIPAGDAPAPASVAGDTTEATEAWSDAIKAQWARLAEGLVAPEADASRAAAAEACSETVALTETAAWHERLLYDSPPIKIFETGPAGERPAGGRVAVDPDAFLRRVADLFFLAKGGGVPVFHIKLFGIDRDGGLVKSRQRLTTRGWRDGREVRSLAVVEATWAVPTTGAGPPRLSGLSIPKVTRSEWLTESTARIDDIASRVLGETEAWQEQLRLGMNTWARRLDRSLKPDFLGYHGIAIGDVDGDGLEDMYLCQPGGLPNLLLRQQADGTLADVSRASGADWLDNSTGALLVDVDNDGDKDLAVATQRAFLVLENDGAGRFAVRAEFTGLGLGYSPTASDIDLDGDLDLLVLRYGADSREVGGFPTPHPFYDARNGGANVLLENQGGFRFVDATEARGLGVGNFRFSFAASWEDYDNDGDADVYIANDFGPNQLFRNNGGKFVDVSVQAGAQDWGFGMSATWADTNRDGFMDLYVSNMFSGAGNQIVPRADFNPTMPGEIRGKYLKMVRGNSLLRNRGDGSFEDVTDPMAEGFGKWAWGAHCADLNNDGWEDIYLANGYISQPDKEDL